MRFWSFPIVILLMGVSLAHGASRFEEEDLWRQGKKDLAEGKAKAARAALEGLLKQYPKEADLHLVLAMTSLKLGDARQAEVHIGRALQLAPDHVEARTLLGWLNLEVHKDYPAAIEAYRRVVQSRPNSAEAQNNLAVALKKNGDLDKALVVFNRALDLREDYAEAWSNRGWVHLEQEKWREARRDFEQALRLNPEDQGALYGMSRVLKQVRDYSGAQEALKKLISRSPNFVYWLEMAQLQLVRYYWVLLLIAGGFLVHSRYRKMRAKNDGS